MTIVKTQGCNSIASRKLTHLLRVKDEEPSQPIDFAGSKSFEVANHEISH